MIKEILKFAFSRYSFYILIALEVFLLPNLVSVSEYSRVELVKSTSNLFGFVLLGAHSGYIYYSLKEKLNFYKPLLFYGIISASITGIAVGFYYEDFIFTVGILTVSVSYIIEKRYQINKKYTLAILFKPLFSIFLLSGVYFLKDASLVLCMSYVVAILIFMILIFKIKKQVNTDIITVTALKLKDYWKLVKKGFPLNVLTILFLLLFYVDRIAILDISEELHTTYSISFNLALMTTLGLSSVNYITSMTLGERDGDLTLSYLYKLLGIGLFLLSVSFLAGLGVFYLLSKYYYIDMNLAVKDFVILVFSLGLFHLIGVVGPVLFYRDKQVIQAVILALVVVISYFLNFVFFEPSKELIILKTLILVICYFFISLILITKTTRKQIFK